LRRPLCRRAVTAAMPGRRAFLPPLTAKPARFSSQMSAAPEGSAYQRTARGRRSAWWLRGWLRS